MALPASYSSEGNAAQAADSMIQIARYCRTLATNYIAQCDAQSLDLDAFVQNFLPAVALYKSRWPNLIAVPGVLAYLQSEFPQKNLTVADLNNVTTALANIITLIEANCPVDANSFILCRKLLKDGTGGTQPRLITNAGSLATLRSGLVSFQSAFDAS